MFSIVLQRFSILLLVVTVVWINSVSSKPELNADAVADLLQNNYHHYKRDNQCCIQLQFYQYVFHYYSKEVYNIFLTNDRFLLYVIFTI